MKPAPTIGALGLLLASHAALAGPADVFGLGARSLGRGGGGVAYAEGAEAARLNPALLARQRFDSFFVGYQAIGTAFEPLPDVWWDTNVDGRVDASDTPLELGTPGGREDGLALGLRRGFGRRVGVGLAAFLPADRLVRISSMEPALPDWFLYNRRLQTFELAAGLGVEPLRGLSLGAGVEVAAGADVRMAGTLSLAVEGAEEGDEDVSQLVAGTTFDMASIDLDVKPRIIPVLSLAVDLGRLTDVLDGLRLGGSWRGSGGIPVDIDVDLQVDMRAQDVGELDPIALALLAELKMGFLDHAVPSRWVAGGAYELADRAVLSADVISTAWSAVVPSVANLDASQSSLQSPLFQLEDPSVADGNAYTVELRDTISLRTGAEARLLDRDVASKIGFLRLAARAGFGWEPSPLVGQGRSSAFLDADRMLVSGGLGVEHGDPFALLEGPVAWDLFYQGHMLASGSLDRGFDDPYTPGAPVDGASIPIGGRLWTAGLQWSLAY